MIGPSFDGEVLSSLASRIPKAAGVYLENTSLCVTCHTNQAPKQMHFAFGTCCMS